MKGRRISWWLELLLRPILVAGAVWLVFQIPLPILDDWLPLKNVIGAALAVTLAGKCLFDTLFFDRHWP